jgi:MraZ protein
MFQTALTSPSDNLPRHELLIPFRGQRFVTDNITAMFIGEYKITIDDKGRIAVPVKFRGALAQGAVVTRGLDTSLFLLPLEEWGKLAEKLASLPLGQANSRAFSRFMLAGAMDVELDGQGRFVIPEYLRTFAGLKKGAVVVGVQNRLEVWDEDVWSAYAKKAEEDSAAIAEMLTGI